MTTWRSSWPEPGPADRWLDLFVERQDEIVDAVIAETGKVRSEAISMEVSAPCDAIAWYAKHAERILRPRRRRIHGLLGLVK